MADNDVTKRVRYEPPKLEVDAALERLSKLEQESRWAKLHPARWPVGVRAAAIAGVTAALVSAKVPAVVASALASWLFGQ